MGIYDLYRRNGDCNKKLWTIWSGGNWKRHGNSDDMDFCRLYCRTYEICEIYIEGTGKEQYLYHHNSYIIKWLGLWKSFLTFQLGTFHVYDIEYTDTAANGNWYQICSFFYPNS